MRLTHGGIFSYYEFPWPMADRLTDEQWNALLGTEREPARPAWTESFLEPAPAASIAGTDEQK